MLDPDGPDTIRLDVADARALGEATLRRIGYPADEAAIITDQLIDNALCGYRFASLPRILAIAEDEKTGKPRTPVRIVHETPVSALSMAATMSAMSPRIAARSLPSPRRR